MLIYVWGHTKFSGNVHLNFPLWLKNGKHIYQSNGEPYISMQLTKIYMKPSKYRNTRFTGILPSLCCIQNDIRASCRCTRILSKHFYRLHLKAHFHRAKAFVFFCVFQCRRFLYRSLSISDDICFRAKALFTTSIYKSDIERCSSSKSVTHLKCIYTERIRMWVSYQIWETTHFDKQKMLELLLKRCR